MSAGVSIIGIVNDGMGGLKESAGAFRKHHVEVGAALLNISGIDTATGEPVDKDEPRPTYQHQAWPKMVFHPDGREQVVQTPAEHKHFIENGFRDIPYVKPQVLVADPSTEKKELLDTNRRLAGRITEQDERLARMEELIQQLKKGKG